MVENYIGPSELHLKKELTALRKARFLRDPETCSSWRSPLSSKSFAITSGLNIQKGTRGSSTSKHNGSEFPQIPQRSDKRRKKVYLYNWRHHSAKSSDSGLQLDEDDRKLTVEGSPEISLINQHKLDPRSDTNLEVAVNIHNVRHRNTTPVMRISRKSKRTAALKQQVSKHSEGSKLLDLPSSSLGDFDSFEQSDDTEYCDSEDLRHLTHGKAFKNGYFSHSASPLFSGSGCGNWSHSSKILRSARREGSSHSYTPASTGSYYRYGGRNPSTVGSLDETAPSGDDLDQLDLPGRQGCGLPCYWSKRTKGRACSDCYSPSLSDILRRKGSSILCGGQTLYQKKRSVSSQKQTYLHKSSQGLPLLTNSSDGGGSSVDSGSDELSTNIGELELEALSRLDGKRWSSCKSQEGLELARSGEADIEMPDQRSLSQKYRPISFDDIIGQDIVVQSLGNAILRGRIAPAYLFHGPRGTGKTSAARIFASALNCLSTDEKKPCGFCRECTQILNGDVSHMQEVDAMDKKGLDSVRHLLKNLSMSSAISRYKVFIIDQCHMLSSKMWSAFLKFLEEPPPRVVFIFIAIDTDSLSRAVLSRCQKYLFCKVKDVDIVNRLRKVSQEENLDVDLDALDLITLNADGSVLDAETMLDQLSLLGKRITTALVNDIVGVVSEEKLLDLLEIAMSSDTAETVRRSRELMDSGVDPMALMSQLAGLIMDIISGTYRLTSSQCSSTALGGRSLTEAELERLQQALKILSDAEKQLRLSSERSTWFTAALLQLGSGHNTEPTQSSSNISKQNAKHSRMGAPNMAEDSSFFQKKAHPSLTFRESTLALVPRVASRNSSPQCCSSSYKIPNEAVTSGALPANGQSPDRSLQNATYIDGATGKRVIHSSDKLAEIWKRWIEGCPSKTLRQLLSAHGRLLSITEAEGIIIASLAFKDCDMKSRVERYLSSITNSIEMVLKRNVEVRIALDSETDTNGLHSVPHLPSGICKENVGFLDKEGKVESSSIGRSSDKGRQKGVSDLTRQNVDYSEAVRGTQGRRGNSLLESKGFQVESLTTTPTEGRIGSHGTIEKQQDISVRKAHVMATDEQRLESAWLQAAEKNTSGAVSYTKPETSQVLPQNSICHQKHSRSSLATKQWEDELSLEFKALKMREAQGYHTKQIGEQGDCYDISPSLLHRTNLAANSDKENLGYESSPGCNGLFCWSARKPPRGKETHVKPQRTRRISLFGHCGKLKEPESRVR